jgi:PAS domain S-box-containing protein
MQRETMIADGPAVAPRALRTLLRVMSASQLPMFVCWGPEPTLYCNAACGPWLGAAHPGALGRPAGEAWPAIAQRAAAALRGDPQTPESPSAGFSFNLVPGDDGKPVGVLGIAVEPHAALPAETASVIETIGEAFVALDADYRIRYVNAQAEKLYGLRRAEVLGGVLWDLFPDLRGSALVSECMRAMTQRVATRFELHYAPWNRWFEGHATPMADGGVATYFRDITERKQADAQLREEMRIGETLNRVGATLAIEMNVDTMVQAVTDGAIELAGAQIGAFEPGLRSRGVLRLDDATLDPRFVENPPFHGLPPDHPPVCSFLAVPVALGGGEPIGGLLLGHAEPGRFSVRHEQLVVGLAAQAAIAIDNSRLYERLRESADRLGLALSAAEAGDWNWDARTDVITLSERAARIFGVAPGPQMKWSAMLSLLHDDDVERVRAAAARSVAQRERYDVEYRIPHFSGRELWIASQAIPQSDANGELIGMFGVVQDISARKRMEGELRQRADELAQADRRKDEFLATLAHELRNPLAPLRNSLELLARPGVAGEMAERARLIMSRQVEQMARLVDELIDISRISSGRIELKPERVALQTLVEHALEIARPLIDQRRHRVEVDLPLQPVWLSVDRTRAAQVLSNLLNNAARYSEPDGRIWIAATGDDAGVTVSVRDAGIGIAPDVLPRIFDMFMQAHRPDDPTQGGLGVGLTLARRLVELHGGALQACSEGRGHGSEFVVRLPPSARLPADDAAAADALAPRPSGAGRRVLVVDDNIDAAESLALLLGPEGHEVVVAHDGEQALKAMAGWRPDVVLLDIGMPRLDGLEVARRVRARYPCAPIKLVATTGWGQQRDLDASRAAGFDEHLVKPVDSLAVLRIVADAPVTNAAPQRGRVLVADDHELVRQSLVELLESDGHDVRTAADGETAIAIAREWRPRFVLLDVHMPGISGLDAARRLRALFAPQEMTLVMLSGMALNDLWREQARAAGFDDCVDKTADPSRLLERLRTPFAVATGDAPC